MKKILSVLIAILLVMYLGTTVFAAEIDEAEGSASTDVKGTYETGGTADIVYSVDVIWGNMEFTYIDAEPGEWNPETHKYDNVGTASWTCETDANKVAVTNHSNTAVLVTLTYTPGASYAGIGGTFSKSTMALPTAVGVLLVNAPNDSSLLTLSGALSSSVTSSTTIGTITVTIS